MAIVDEEKEAPLMTIGEFLKELKTGAYWKEVNATVGHNTYLFDIEKDGVLVPRVWLD